MALQATTTAGLAVKARMARFSCKHFWRETADANADWDHLVARKLIESVLELAAKA
jgi:hypothetical protein